MNLAEKQHHWLVAATTAEWYSFLHSTNSLCFSSAGRHYYVTGNGIKNLKTYLFNKSFPLQYSSTDGLPHGDGTGPDLSRFSIYFSSFFSLIFLLVPCGGCGSVFYCTLNKPTQYRIVSYCTDFAENATPVVSWVVSGISPQNFMLKV